LSSDKILLYLI